MVRKAGKVVWCRGWVPVPGWLNYAKAFFLGSSVPGQWQDDSAMLDDPTCVSFEIPCTDKVADALQPFWASDNKAYRNYSFEVSDTSCNCVINATQTLARFLDKQGMDEKNYFNTIQSPLQGRLMRQILGGTLIAQPASATTPIPSKL